MKRIARLSLIMAALFFGTVFTNTAQAQDKRVERLLDELGYKYDLTSSDDFKLTFKVDDDGERTHMIFINSNTSDFREFEIREIYGIVYRGSRRPNRDMYERVLQYTEKVKLGYFSLLYSDDSDTWTILFNAQVSADLKAEYLKSTIMGVVEVADKMEKEFEDFSREEDKY